MPSSTPKWVSEPDERNSRVKGLFGSQQLYNGIVSVNPSGLWMPKEFEEIAEEVYNFEVKPDDVWIITYPKCGTTWAQVSTFCVKNPFWNEDLFFIGNDLVDFE